MRGKLRFPRPRRTKYSVGITLFFVLCLCTVGYWGVEKNWAYSKQSLYSDGQKADDVSKGIEVNENLSVEELNKASSSLKPITSRSCDIAFWQRWRTFMSDEVVAYERQCSGLVAVSSEATRAVDAMTERLESEKRVAQILSDAQVAIDSLELSQYSEAAEVWLKTSDALGKVETDTSIEVEVKTLSDQAKRIAEAYSAVKLAGEGSDRTAFDNASIALQRSYQEMGNQQAQTAASYEVIARAAAGALMKLQLSR